MSSYETRSGQTALERDRDLGSLVQDAWRLFNRRFGLSLMLAAIVVVPVEIVVFGIGLGELTAGYDAEPPLGETVFALLVSGLVTTPLVTGMLVHVAAADGREQPVGVGEAVRAGLESFGPLLVAVLLFTAGTMLGFLALIVPGIFLALRWSLVAPVVIVEGKRGTGALRRSWELVSGHTGWVLVVMVVQTILVAVASVFLLIPAGGLAEEADAQVYALLGGIVVQVLTMPFTAYVTTLLFYTLRVRSRTGAGSTAGGWAGSVSTRLAGEADVAEDAAPSEPHDDPREDSTTPEAPGGWKPPVPPR